MKIINPSFEILEQKPGLQGIYEQIEIAGRTCYASTHVIKYDDNGNSATAKDFVDRMITSQHYAMLEHGTVYLKIDKGTYAYYHYVVVCEPDDDFLSSSYELAFRPYTKVNIQEDYIYVTTNLRVLVKNGWMDDLQYLCEPTEHHEKRITVRFITDIGVSREFNRHRVDSIAEQSTRYCNFSKDKFNNEISVCFPPEFKEDYISRSMLGNALVDYCGDPLQGLCIMISNEQTNEFTEIDYWLFANLACEWSYMNLVRLGWKPQQARRILPLDLVTELVHTAFVSDWQHFFDLRAKGTTGAPHPDANMLAVPLLNEFINRNYINE